MKIASPRDVSSAKLFLWRRGVGGGRHFARKFAQAAVSMGLTFDQLWVLANEKRVEDKEEDGRGN